jgi:hypothetical protein
MSQQLHTDDLARTARPEGARADRDDRSDDDVVVAELAEPGEQRAGGATTGQPREGWPPPADADRHWAGISDADQLRARWEAIQAGFVDEPRRAVEEADSLVAQVIRELAESFAAERARLEAQWSRGDQVGTEDLRVALQRYRSFFQDLLAH